MTGNAEVTEFVYLAVVLDAFSRKVEGGRWIDPCKLRLPTSALERAIISRQPPPGLVHHSDQGVQYRCAGYLQVLRDHRMVASISRPGYPYDKDYASHCTSSIRCDITRFTDRWDSLIPCAFRGGFSPGSSYRQSFLSL